MLSLIAAMNVSSIDLTFRFVKMKAYARGWCQQSLEPFSVLSGINHHPTFLGQTLATFLHIHMTYALFPYPMGKTFTKLKHHTSFTAQLTLGIHET